VSVWDAASGKPLERFLGTTHGPVFSAVFSPDGQRVVSATDDGQVVIWDVASGRGTAYHVHTGAVMDAAYSPDGGRIVSASADDTVQILNTHGAQVAVLRGHRGAVNSASFSPDGRRIVSASSDQTVRVWDSASGTQLAMFEGDAPFNWAGYSPDQRRIVSASADGTVRIWDAAAAGNVPAPLTANTPAPAPQRSLASEWQGKYMYAPGDTRSPVPFTWVLHVKGTSITGREDEINTFGDKSAPKLGASLVGTINGASVAIEKTYNGTGGVNHSVAYQGTISPDERSMSGIWTIGPTAGSFSVTATGK
jgi:WD40 repeat protein